MAETLLAVEAITGDIITEVNDVDLGQISQTIGRYETAQGTLPISDDVRSPDWLRATKPGASFLLLADDNPSDPSHGILQWGGMVTRRRRDHTDQVKLDLITGEGVLDRLYVGDEDFENEGQNVILQTLITNYVQNGARPGLPIRVQFETPGNGTLRVRKYADQDDKTVYSLAQELMGVDGGPEWTMSWEWTGPTQCGLVFRVGDRIGSAVQAGYSPAAVFDIPGCVSALELLEDYGAGKGATSVMATSSGEGVDRPQSIPVLAPDPDRPTFEYRFTPSTSISDVNTLNKHAETMAAQIGAGTTTMTMTCDVEAAPRLGIDWGIGDDVGCQVTDVPAFPGGLDTTPRVAGWQKTTSGERTIAPVLFSPTGDFDG